MSQDNRKNWAKMVSRDKQLDRKAISGFKARREKQDIREYDLLYEDEFSDSKGGTDGGTP